MDSTEENRQDRLKEVHDKAESNAIEEKWIHD